LVDKWEIMMNRHLTYMTTKLFNLILVFVVLFSVYPKPVLAVDACAEDAILFDHTAYDREDCRRNLACAISGSVPVSNDNAGTNATGIYFYGDSIMVGMQPFIQNSYADKIAGITAIGGMDTNRSVTQNLIVPPPGTQTAVINMGTNDFADTLTEEAHSKQVDKFVAVLRKDNANLPIYWINVKVDATGKSPTNAASRIAVQSTRINKVINDAATRNGNMKVLDWISESANGYTFSDGIHLTGDSYKKRADWVMSQLGASPGTSSSTPVQTPGSTLPNADMDAKILKLLTVRADTPAAINAAIDKKIGGVLVRATDFSDSATLEAIKKARSKGMMVATDGEPVGYLNVMDRLGVLPPTKTGVELANLPDKTRQDYFEKVANKMKEVGISINYAPVADVKKPGLPGLELSITNRIMGDDAAEVAKVSGEFATAMRSAGITPVFKHFPGHGSTPKNSDEGITHNTQTLAYLEANDFVPYRKNLTGNSAVMVGNFYVDAIDPTQPAIFSTKVVQETLRKKLNFSGLVVTDDLSAKGLDPTPMGDRFVKALAAGADVLEFQGLNNVDIALTSIREAVTGGKISETQLSNSYNNVASGTITPSQQEQASGSLAGCSCSAGGDASLVGSDNAEKVWNYFIGPPQNFDAIHTAAIIGNFMQESGPKLDSTIVNSIGAVGIAQWLDRRPNLEKFAGSRDLNH
jgi:beta-N-acetylhexosaminidase